MDAFENGGHTFVEAGLKHWKIEHECTMSFFFRAAEYLLLPSHLLL